MKHKTRANKKNTFTKLITSEFAIIEENGTINGTADYKTAIEAVKQGKQVFNIKTYQLKITTKLKEN